MAAVVARHVAPVRKMTPDDFMLHDSLTSMAKPLVSADYRRPILELFDGMKNLGIYLAETVDFSKAPEPELIRVGTRFLNEALTALDGFTVTRNRSLADRAFHNREVTVTTRVAARSSVQAQKAKTRDRFTCQICLEKPEQRYGAEGRACLEAHHVRPLHTLNPSRRVTRLPDLVTVCANCHRVLGRLAQEERSFHALRERFAKKAKS
jgi:hypothetical protein